LQHILDNLGHEHPAVKVLRSMKNPCREDTAWGNVNDSAGNLAMSKSVKAIC
jgi:hypothetical protein